MAFTDGHRLCGKHRREQGLCGKNTTVGDLTVIDHNLFEIPVEELFEINVLATMMNDKVVHEEAVDWDPPGDPLTMDFCGFNPDK